MTKDLQGKHILFYGLIREEGFADFIASELVSRGATIYCLAAPELTPEGEARLRARSIEVIRTPLWYGIKDDDYPESFKTLKKPEDILAYQPDEALCASLIESSATSSLEEARSIFAELSQRTGGKIDGIIHIMAGGIPRTRGMMMITKSMLGTNDPDRFISTAEFIKSPVFKCFVGPNMDLVTAVSYDHIFTAAKELLSANPHCPVVALGYQGEHVVDTDGRFVFTSYPGYLVGFAKNLLQSMSQTRRQQGYQAVTINLMGAETASTSAFSGIEYYILNSLRQLEISGKVDTAILRQQCQSRLLEGVSTSDVVGCADEYLFSPQMLNTVGMDFPVHSSLEVLSLTMAIEQKIIGMHKDRRELMTSVISSHVKQLMAEHFWDEALEATEAAVLLDTKRIIERL